MNNSIQILYNGKIRTQNPNQPQVSALAIHDGKILFAGSDADVLNAFNGQVSKHDLGGKTVWPGLTDAHIHMDYYGQGLRKIDCEVPTLQECLRRVAERASQVPAGEWILGHGWNQNVWPEGFGNAAMLDEVAPNNPVILTAKSLHASWGNTLAMQAAGLASADTPDPENGTLQRDAHGKPTGIVFERAIDNLAAALPPITEAQLAEIHAQAQASLWKMGITGVHDFDQARSFAAWQILEREDRLRLRIVKSIGTDFFQGAIDAGLRTGFGGKYIRIGSVKIFADGALGPQTAAMFQPYEGSTDAYGILLLDAEGIFEMGQRAVRHGISVATHAIGDKGIHGTLDAYQALREYEKANQLPALRHRIEHVQVLHPADTHRLAELGIIASMQPLHATSDMLIADHFWGNRAALSYAWRTVLSHQTALAFGSDAPVESPNPFWGMHAAVTRCRQDGTPGPHGWYPEQRLTLEEALAGYTTGPAYAGGWEDVVGRLAPGYYADLIVLPEDPFAMPPQELPQVAPDATMVNGEWVWEKDTL